MMTKVHKTNTTEKYIKSSIRKINPKELTEPRHYNIQNF